MPHAPAEILERASATSLHKEPSGLPKTPDADVYSQVKSPGLGKELENGALRAGDAPVFWSKNYMAILMQYGGMGVIYSVMYSLIYPVLNVYLHMSGYVTASAYVLIALPYTLKLFFGIIIDCVPIMGYRRRPYMIIGAGICTICCIIMACMSLGDPYYPEYDWLLASSLTPEQLAQINYDAPGSGAKWVVLMILANIGIVLGSAAVGGAVVEYSQREPESIRGRLQTLIWVARDVGGVVASLIVGFGLNSEDYGGSFSSDIGINALMAICAVFSLLTAASAWFVVEERAERRSMRKEVLILFDLIQMRVVYQVLAFQFFMNMFSYVSVTASSPIASVWATVEPLTSNIITICSYVISMAALTFISQYGLNWSWRSMIVWCQVAVVVVDIIPTFLTIWDVVRNQWFWLGFPLLENIPSNFSFIVSTYCMVEIMEEGNESTFYGLTVAVSSLASPFATVITKNIDANFDIEYADIQLDSNHVRWQVTYAYIIAYAFKIFSVVFVLLLPRQKAECQELRRTGGKSKTVGWIVVVVLVFLYIWCILTNVMSIFPSTSCYTIAGGSGCS